MTPLQQVLHFRSRDTIRRPLDGPPSPAREAANRESIDNAVDTGFAVLSPTRFGEIIGCEARARDGYSGTELRAFSAPPPSPSDPPM
jgi:hypothetical protein